jgi:beta-lactam-binding protein with PASTA domain
VPDVVGNGNNSYSDAQKILAKKGFNNVVQGCSVVPPGSPGNPNPQIDKVVSSSPAKGSQASASTQITVNIGQVTCP